MDPKLMMFEREYVTMETLNAGNYLAIKKADYDRIVFLTEVYGTSLDIPDKETVLAIPILEKQNRMFELSPTGSYMIPVKQLKLTIILNSSIPEN